MGNLKYILTINNVNAINSNQAVKELNIHKTNNKEDAIKYAIQYYVKSLGRLPNSPPKTTKLTTFQIKKLNNKYFKQVKKLKN